LKKFALSECSAGVCCGPCNPSKWEADIWGWLEVRRSAILHYTVNQRLHWACWQYGHSGGTQGWLGVKRWQLSVWNTSHSANCQRAAVGHWCPIQVVTFNLISILATDYIQKRRDQIWYQSKSDYMDRAWVSLCVCSVVGWLIVYQLGILSLSCSQYSQTICWHGWDDNPCLGVRNTSSIGAWPNSLDRIPPQYCIVSLLLQTKVNIHLVQNSLNTTFSQSQKSHYARTWCNWY
jgi:hypothetical protein